MPSPVATICHKPFPNVFGKSVVYGLDTQWKLDIFYHIKVTKCMGNRFHLSVAQRTGSV